MSSSSNARVTTQTERRSVNDSSTTSKPRIASGLSGSKPERGDGRMPHSQPLGGPPSHKRMPSGSQRSGRNVEERSTERVQVTTRETLISRTRSPDRRPGPPVVAAERSKPVGSIKINNKDMGSKISRGEPAQGTPLNPLPS